MSTQPLTRFSRVLHDAASTSGFLTSDDLRRLDVPNSTVDRWVRLDLLHRIQAGVFRTSKASFGFGEMLDLAGKLMTDQQVLGGRTGLEIWELPGGTTTRPHVYGPQGRGTRSSFVVNHQVKDLAPVDVTTRMGHRVTTPVRTVLDASAFCSDAEIGEQLTAGVQRRLFAHRDIAIRSAELARRGKPGVGRVRRLVRGHLSEVDLTMNSYERDTRLLIKRGGFPDPIPQLRVAVNGKVYFLDFAWPKYRRFLECDSMLAHSSPLQLQSDLERQNNLVADGWVPLRFTHQDVNYRSDYVIAQLSKHLPRVR